LAQKKIAKCLDHTSIVVFMTLLTIYALYFDDLRMILFRREDDDVFYGISLLCMICFAIEILLSSYAKPEYMFSFFFYLDIVSTVSMIADCGWIWEAIVGESTSNTSATDLAKTSRASKVTRVIRILRLIRLIRIVKLYKQKQMAQRKASEIKAKANRQINLVRKDIMSKTNQVQKSVTNEQNKIENVSKKPVVPVGNTRVAAAHNNSAPEDRSKSKEDSICNELDESQSSRSSASISNSQR
jgi:archaellum component FlaF (FlaF/FlaG flagellin family)